MKDFAAVLAMMALFVAVCWAISCTAVQKDRARTLLDASLCVQAAVRNHVEDDLNDPLVWAALSDEVAEKCVPEVP